MAVNPPPPAPPRKEVTHARARPNGPSGPAHRWSPPWRLIRIAAGFGALFSGTALLTNIVAGLSLPLALALIATFVVAGIGALLARTSGARRRALLRMMLAGAGTGIVATVCYDVAKYGLSQLDASPFNPFEATRLFGVLLLGSETHPLVQVAGWSFHLLNGTSFGLAYCFLFSREGRSSLRYAALSGMAWGLFLATFQLVFYPDWLDILFVGEFQRISALSHLVYGTVLGVVCRQVLRRGPLRAGGGGGAG